MLTPPAQYGGPAPGALPNKRATVGNTLGGSGGGGTPGGGAPAPGSSIAPRGRMCVFQRNFQCSPSIVGAGPGGFHWTVFLAPQTLLHRHGVRGNLLLDQIRHSDSLQQVRRVTAVTRLVGDLTVIPLMLTMTG